jgi:hypothetical protein
VLGLASTTTTTRRTRLATGCAVLFLLGLQAQLGVGGELEAKEGDSVFYGYASPEPSKWENKPTKVVEISVCGRTAAPRKGAVMTVVPASPALPAVVAHVVKKAGKACMWLEQIKDPSWLKGSWSEGGAWAYPRVLVLPGEMPKAHALDLQEVSDTSLPPGTESKYVRLAIDSDGDGRVDAIVRNACGDGGYACDEPDCQEVWWKKGDRWRLENRICGD